VESAKEYGNYLSKACWAGANVKPIHLRSFLLSIFGFVLAYLAQMVWVRLRPGAPDGFTAHGFPFPFYFSGGLTGNSSYFDFRALTIDLSIMILTGFIVGAVFRARRRMPA